jgi:hypothetical protein
LKLQSGYMACLSQAGRAQVSDMSAQTAPISGSISGSHDPGSPNDRWLRTGYRRWSVAIGDSILPDISGPHRVLRIRGCEPTATISMAALPTKIEG